MWKCGNVANTNVANSQLGIGHWQHFHIGTIAANPPLCAAKQSWARTVTAEAKKKDDRGLPK